MAENRARPPAATETPRLSLAALKGPFRLEAKYDYQDSAVMGGLGPFVARVVEQAGEDAGSAAQRAALVELRDLFAGYGGADPKKRSSIIARGEELLAALETGRSPGPSPRDADRPLTPLDTPVTALRGVNQARAELLSNLGVRTVGDLLRHYPIRHEDRRHVAAIADLGNGQTVSVLGEVAGPGETEIKGRRRVTKVPLRDDTGTVHLTWFNQPFRAEQFKPGTTLFATGTVRYYWDEPHLQAPECEVVGRRDPLHVKRIVPIHGLTKGLYAPQVRRFVHDAVARFGSHVGEFIPPDIIARQNLCGAEYAVGSIHFPADEESLAAARRRIVFEELFLLQVRLGQLRHAVKADTSGVAIDVKPEYLAELEGLLPYELTAAQRRVIEETGRDLASPTPGNRLLHGDVGSGKTVVAGWALLVAARSGHQAAFMAPTEILAEQQHRVLRELFGPLGVEVALLIGGVRKGRKQLLERIGSGEVSIVVGTHALIQEGVSFLDLQLAVIDEQHRFGVLQRAALRDKGYNPNVIVMTATPIPRTLALTVYGDLDISVLDEMPPGREEIVTEVVTMRRRARAYDFIRQEVSEGKQAFIVCPLVEQSEKLDVQAATELARHLQREVFPDLRVGLIHGRMPVQEKDDVMAAFRRQQLDVLCSTTVVEVGVDVPNASVMLVENAERFGLAQLHQLRGRVGRGQHQSHCLLVVDRKSSDAWERLEVLSQTNDGFKIAEADLRFRGPGEFCGTRQHGLPDLKMADIMADTPALVAARREAFALIERDPDLARPEHEALRVELLRRLGEGEVEGVEVS